MRIDYKFFYGLMMGVLVVSLIEVIVAFILGFNGKSIEWAVKTIDIGVRVILVIAIVTLASMRRNKK